MSRVGLFGRGMWGIPTLLSIALVASGALVALDDTAEADQRRVAKARSVAKQVSERPDARSAMVSARAQGARVEDVSARTATSSTWANPDGTWTSEMHAGVQRFRDSEGAWRDVDLDLAPTADGGVAPRGSAVGLKLSGGGSGGALSTTESQGRSVSLAMPGKLPKPTLDGSRATYAEIAPGVDMVVEALRSGYEQTYVVKDRAAAVSPGGLSWSVALKTKGLKPRSEADGSISFVDQKNTVRSRIPAAVAWDSKVDPRNGEHTDVSPVKLGLAVKSPGQATLTITPDPAWLNDPETVFPVTVDPTYAVLNLTPSLDTFVQQGYTTAQASATELKLGNNGSGQIARSFLNFPTSSLKGKDVVSATLKLYETHSWSCSARNWEVWRPGEATTSTVWTNQPAWYTKWATTSATKGFSSSCPDGTVTATITGMVDLWSTNTAATNLIGIRASDESDPYGWKRFASSETANDPVVSITYNRAPNQTAKPRLSSASTSYPNGDVYSALNKPTFTSSATDPDANTTRLTYEVHSSTAGTSASLVATCVSGWVASGAAAPCTLTTALSDATYQVRAHASDARLWGTWSGWFAVKIASGVPAAPVISCPGFADGFWAQQPPSADVECTITATGSGLTAPNTIKYALDGKATVAVSITASSDPAVAKTTVTVSKAKGGHRISAWAVSPAGVSSAEAKYGFGYGALAVDSPGVSPVPVTTSTVRVAATGPAPAANTTATAALKWRLPSGADENADWNDAGAPLEAKTDPATGGLSISGTLDTTRLTRDAVAGIDLDERIPTTIELQVCVTYPSGSSSPANVQCTWTSQPLRVIRVPHAFGEGFPVTEAGPGQVALWTGEFTTTETDATVPGYTGTLSLSRTHSTFAGPANPAASIFGPGWVASLDGTDEGGLAGSQLIDNTLVDGTLVLVDSEGTPMVFAPKASVARRTGADLATGEWPAVDQDTIEAGVSARVDGTGTSTVVSVTEDDGTVTRFKPATSTSYPKNGAAGVFVPASVSQQGSGTTTYTRDPQGRVSRILAPVPPGLTSADCPGEGALKAGCRALDISYAATTTATASAPGDYAGQVSKLSMNLYNPAKVGGAGVEPIEVATYKYDPSGRLVSVTDPRTGLSTAYAYDAGNRLTSITPAGQAAFTLEYAGTPTKFARVKRANPASAGGGTATLASVVYDVATSGAGLPDFSKDGVATWKQTGEPAKAFAVFGQDHPVTTIDAGQVSSGDWEFADLYATDARGYTTNTASYGAGDWQRTATDYDPATGQVLRTLTATDIDRVVNQAADPDTVGTITRYNSGVDGDHGLTGMPAGAVVTETWETSRPVMRTDGTVVSARPHTTHIYDQGSPNSGRNPDTSQAWGLVTTSTTTLSSPLIEAGDFADTPSVTKTAYGADAAAWKLGQPTSTTQVVDGGAGDITSVTEYDLEGRVVAQRQPMSNGSDAGTRKTVYYTVAANSSHPECGGKAQWAGAVCKTTYAAQAGGHDLITTTYSGYNAVLAPATVTETANGAQRVTTTTFDTAWRPVKVATTATGLSGSLPVKGSETKYDDTTGQPTQVWSLDAAGARTGTPITTGYDSWGRAVAYSPTTGEDTTTTYDAAGRVASVVDVNGTRTFTYDGTDLEGKKERRGLATGLTVSGGPSGGTLEFKGAYDREGGLRTQSLPGGISQRVETDGDGHEIGRTYSGQVTTVNPDGSSTVEADAGWLGWSIDRDVNGRVRREMTPDAAALTTGGVDPSNPTAAAAYDRVYGYDKADRLVSVQDRTAAAGAGVDPATGEPLGAGCVTRAYGFDRNGNRVSKTSSPAASDGLCQTGSGSTSRTWSYDSGDRVSGAGYVFDALGRNTTLPAGDAPVSSNGDVTLGYYDTDAVASITQVGVKTSWTLDAAGRRFSESVAPASGGTATKATTRHYSDASDDPAWVDVTEGVSTTRTRFETSLGGDLGLTLTGPANAGAAASKAEVTLADPHGDVVATSEVTGQSTPAVGLAGWTDHDEYGNPLGNAMAASGAITEGLGYGWVGAKQRATLDTGLTLMGARVYNRATGIFTSTDPVYGGNPTTYGYPVDPVNMFDLNGQWGWFKKAWKWVKKHKVDIAITAVGFVPGVGIGAWAIRAYRVVRLARAGQESTRAARATSWLAGRMWVGRGGARSFAKNGARMWSRGEGKTQVAWRGSVHKHGYGYSSNLTRSVQGRHDYFNFHINHRSPRRWAPWW